MAISREQIAAGLMEGAVYSVVVRPENYDIFEGAFNGVLRQENGGVAENHLHHKGMRTTRTIVLWTDINGIPYLEGVLERATKIYREKGGESFAAERAIKSRMEISEAAS